MSAPDLSCFDYIIGLYNGDCECYSGKPLDFDQSESGLYISDLLEPKFIDSLLNCDQGASIWELMEIVRELAIRNFIADANALLMKQARLIRIPYRGGIGRATWTKNLSLTAGDYAGARMRCAPVRSGFIKINKIGLIPSVNCSPSLLIYNLNGDLIDTIILNGVANKHTQTAVNIELPLYDEYLDNQEYFFIYQVGAWQPKNNDVSCTCERFRPLWGGFSQYNQHKRHNWAQWLQVGGWTDSTLPSFNADELGSASNYMYGLTFDVDLGCRINEIFCKINQLHLTFIRIFLPFIGKKYFRCYSFAAIVLQ